MATWQYSFKLIPQDRKDSEIELASDWSEHMISVSSLEKISTILLPVKSWSANIKQYGDLEKSCIELFYNKKALEEVSLRIDLRDVSINLLTLLVEFAEENNAVLITENDKIIEPSLESILDELKGSGAYNFIKNPIEFLKSLKKNY